MYETIFKLATMCNGYLSGAVFSTMYKDFTFQINNITYNVHTIGKMNKIKDDTSPFSKRQKITIKSSNSNKNIIGYLVYYKGYENKAFYYGNTGWEQLSRDIEGLINVDLLNINNPFHEKSKLYNVLEKSLIENNITI